MVTQDAPEINALNATVRRYFVNLSRLPPESESIEEGVDISELQDRYFASLLLVLDETG
jgi:hypothetical protein